MRTETATERIAELERWFSLICREVKRLRERNHTLETENKALKADFDWLDTHVVRVSNPKDELIFFRAPGASPTRTYIAEARSAGESPNAS